MKTTSTRPRGAAAEKTLPRFVRQLETIVAEKLGADESAARIRRYVAEHDAPADDRAAFARLCTVIFAQGLGYDTVLSKAGALNDAFAGFDPAVVAGFEDARIRALMDAPIIRNEAKIRACVENAKRWVALAEQSTSYLARVAEVGATDDASLGWPALTATLCSDFARIGELAARQVLKRWGFFTAAAHPGARRVLERLGFVEASLDGAAVQMLVGRVAQRSSRDPYSVEAVLALFASIGPCRKSPECRNCGVADRCPSAMV
jgi:DNA-3-methyladenine glycosylase I